MGLFDDIKTVLRVTATELDSEVQMLIDAAEADMARVGVDADRIDEEDPLVKQAIACYCKARFGFDNDDADYYERSYRQSVADMLNSSDYNTAAGDE